MCRSSVRGFVRSAHHGPSNLKRWARAPFGETFFKNRPGRGGATRRAGRSALATGARQGDSSRGSNRCGPEGVCRDWRRRRRARFDRSSRPGRIGIARHDRGTALGDAPIAPAEREQARGDVEEPRFELRRTPRNARIVRGESRNARGERRIARGKLRIARFDVRVPHRERGRARSSPSATRFVAAMVLGPGQDVADTGLDDAVQARRPAASPAFVLASEG